MSTIKHEQSLRNSAEIWLDRSEFTVGRAKRVIESCNAGVGVDRSRVSELLRGMVDRGEIYKVSRDRYKRTPDNLLLKSWRKHTDEQLGIRP